MIAGLISFERIELCGGDDSQWGVGEIFFKERADVVGPIAQKPKKHGVLTDGRPEESITDFF